MIMLIIISLCACSTSDNNAAEFQIQTFKKEIRFQGQENVFFAYHVEILFPEIISYSDQNTIEDINFELNRFFFGDQDVVLKKNSKVNFDRYIDKLTEAFQQEIRALPDSLPMLTQIPEYNLRKTARVIYNRNKILSVACQIYQYTGGVHGNHDMEYLHFDMNTGMLFGIDELFDKNNKVNLFNLVSDKLEEMKKEKKEVLFEEAKIEDIDKFYFDKSYFCFVYDPYELGPYSSGFIEIKIPKSKIKPLLKKDIYPGFLND